MAELTEAERRVGRALRELHAVGEFPGPLGESLWRLRLELMCAQCSHARARQALEDDARSDGAR
jgi:hypothetical protein